MTPTPTPAGEMKTRFVSCCYWSLGPGGVFGLPTELAAKWLDMGRTIFLGSYQEACDAYSRLKFGAA